MLAIDVFFKGILHHLPRPHVLTAKGLAFVQMYGVYEFTVRESVRASILDIKTKGLAFSVVRLELLGLLLDAEYKSAYMAGQKKSWSNRIEMLRKTGSADAVNTNDDTFPADGSHFRRQQLEVIWALFGIAGPVVPDPRLYPLINELVEHRNAIAHGRSTPEAVGGRYSDVDVIERIAQCHRLCEHVIGQLEQHCATPANLLR